MPPPDVIQASGEDLDPMSAVGGVDVSVEYATMDPKLDTIYLKRRGTPGAGTSEDLELPGDASGRVQFHLPGSFVGANIGKPVTVNYDVKRYKLGKESESLFLNILRFQDPENELPCPQIPQASDDILDLMIFTGDARILVDAWPFIALNQRVWLRLEGETGSGDAYSIAVRGRGTVSITARDAANQSKS